MKTLFDEKVGVLSPLLVLTMRSHVPLHPLWAWFLFFFLSLPERVLSVLF